MRAHIPQVLTLVACCIVLAACSNYSNSTVITQRIKIHNNNLHFSRETWGLTDNHTSLYLLELRANGEVDTVLTQAGNNCTFYKLSGDSLLIYAPDIKQTSVIKRGEVFI